MRATYGGADSLFPFLQGLVGKRTGEQTETVSCGEPDGQENRNNYFGPEPDLGANPAN